jgi:hypothetical protein
MSFVYHGKLSAHIMLSYSFANANVLLVLGELMGGDDDGTPKKSASTYIPKQSPFIPSAPLTLESSLKFH